MNAMPNSEKKEIASYPYKMAEIPARLLTVNRNYQRPVVPGEVNSIIAEFDWKLINPVKVVKRDALYYICDGQQTATALHQLFGPEFRVPCIILDDVESSKGEARVLADTNTGTGAGKKLTQNQLFDALFWADDPVTVDIDAVARKHGFALGSKGKAELCRINAVNAVRKARKVLTDDQFNAMFHIIKSAWGDDPDGVSSSVIRGMARFIKVYWGDYDEKNLIRRLAKHRPIEIIRNGRASFCKGDAKWAREILEIYNAFTSTNRLSDRLQ